MLFNSPIFLFAFLPVAVTVFYLMGHWKGGVAARAWLVAASLFFYSWTVPQYFLLLAGSLISNYYFGRQIEAQPSRRLAKLWLVLGVCFNLALIGYFKYASFLVGNVSFIFGLNLARPEIALPLAISFFTFQQIAFLVNAYWGKSLRPSLLEYVSFVVFFPHLIAGPIVQHSDIIPQFRDERIYRFDVDRFATGMTIFLLGLAKKVVLADRFGAYADVAFGGAAKGAALTFYEAWGGALAYTLQLYFDFSGYSDMAIGLGLVFGIRMPQNFNSPYKSRSISEFWRRWHMTLSRFLREFVYIPLGGNRAGQLRRYLNLMATMLIGGLWHGASWTFVIWGGLHGLYLVINHGWDALRARVPLAGRFMSALGGLPALTLTLLGVVVGWVIFRATTLGAAAAVFRGMLGCNGVQLPAELIARIPPLHLLGAPIGKLNYFNDGTNVGFIEMSLLLLLGMVVCLRTPNVQEMSPRWKLAMVVASFALVLQRVLFSGQISPFLYFRF
jgi:D-alanyl-lipoteichoic acid acyltransferase DltB (MBOAT superfamily)